LDTTEVSFTGVHRCASTEALTQGTIVEATGEVRRFSDDAMEAIPVVRVARPGSKSVVGVVVRRHLSVKFGNCIFKMPDDGFMYDVAGSGEHSIRVGTGVDNGDLLLISDTFPGVAEASRDPRVCCNTIAKATTSSEFGGLVGCILLL